MHAKSMNCAWDMDAHARRKIARTRTARVANDPNRILGRMDIAGIPSKSRDKHRNAFVAVRWFSAMLRRRRTLEFCISLLLKPGRPKGRRAIPVTETGWY